MVDCLMFYSKFSNIGLGLRLLFDVVRGLIGDLVGDLTTLWISMTLDLRFYTFQST